MKRLIVTLLAGMVLMCGFSHVSAAPATALATANADFIDQFGKTVTYVYTSTTAVTQGNTTIFKIATPAIAGAIRNYTFTSSSLDADIWGSEKDEQAITSAYTRFAKEGVNLTHSPDFAIPRTYINRDTTAAAFLYFAIKNDSATSTGNWILVITYEKL